MMPDFEVFPRTAAVFAVAAEVAAHAVVAGPEAKEIADDVMTFVRKTCARRDISDEAEIWAVASLSIVLAREIRSCGESIRLLAAESRGPLQ